MGGQSLGRKVTDVDEARGLLVDWEQSGERMSAWCEKRGINWYSLSAFKGWYRGPATGTELVEVELRSELPPVEVPNSAPAARYRIVVGDVTVEVDDDFRDDTLKRLLRLVASC